MAAHPVFYLVIPSLYDAVTGDQRACCRRRSRATRSRRTSATAGSSRVSIW
jgi:hypothetical protein